MNNRIRKIGSVSLMTLGLLIVLRTALAQDRSTSISVSNEFRVCNTNGSYSQTIQSAVDAAQPGDVIKVAAGVYTESFPVYDYNLYISKTVHLFGGYTCADWLTRDPSINVVTIRPTTTDMSVIFISGIGGQTDLVTPTIDGFLITGGGGVNHGGGLRVNDSNALINNNVISGNIGYLLGGGIFVQRGAPLIQNNRIENNTATYGGYGGGLELENTQAVVMNNMIANNFITDTGGFGGGIAVDGGGPITLSGNSIMTNAAAITGTGYGGGIYIAYNAIVHLNNNQIQSNTANLNRSGYGGGVYVTANSTVTLISNTVMSNTAGYRPGQYLVGGGIWIDSSAVQLSDNLIAGNRANRASTFGNGGGLAVLTSTINIQGGQILNNSTAINCEGYGGGLYALNSSVSIDAALIENNCAANTPSYGLGGALAFFNSPYTLTNNLIVRNRSFGNDTAVGGLYANTNSPGLVINNSFVNNKGQGIRTAAPITLTNNLIMSHTTGISLTAAVPVSVTYNDFYANTTHQRGFSLGLSNFTFNPQLDGIYHLKSASVLIDAGSRSHAPDHDVDSDPRPMIGSSGLYRFDIGADEFLGPAQVNFDLSKRSADLTLIGPGNPIDNAASDGSNDWIGFAALGGDINNDQRDDLIVGAPNLSDDFDGGVDDSGRVFALNNNGTRRLGLIDLLTITPSLEVRSWLNQQHIGRSFAAADVTSDNINDLIIGSIGGDDNGKPVTGTVYIFNGGAGLSGTRTLSPTMQAQHRIISNQSTQSFADKNELVVGQLNNSGPSDLAVGESNATVLGRANAGAVYVFFGSSSLPAVWDMRVLSASLSIYGEQANDGLGEVAVGDVDGDGKLDLVARSFSKVYIFYGPLSTGVRDLASISASATITGLGIGALAVGDVDGDGKVDILTGNGNEVVLIRGGTLASTQNVSTVAVDHITGLSASALRAFDWNHDGKADMIVGDSFNNRAFVFMGSAAAIGTADILDRADWIIAGEKSTDQFGYSIGSGDLDADGFKDLIIGSRSHVLTDRADPHFNDAGAVYVFYAPVRKVYLPLILK